VFHVILNAVQIGCKKKHLGPVGDEALANYLLRRQRIAVCQLFFL
jgi:hypothetical protein